MSKNIINLENNYPTVEEALTRLRLEISAMRRIGVKTLKVIHGYGSTGQGGAIRLAVRRYLKKLEMDGSIRAICPGELFGPFEKEGREMLKLDKSFSKDSDWARHNDGITMVAL